MATKVNDAYTVLLREKKLPLQLLEDPEKKLKGKQVRAFPVAMRCMGHSPQLALPDTGPVPQPAPSPGSSTLPCAALHACILHSCGLKWSAA